MTKLTPVDKIPSYAVIIRCIHERGSNQEEALDELARRRLWLSEQQAEQAGVSRERAGLGPLSVTRYVGTYVNADGQRTLMTPSQGRHTYATAEEAQAWVDAVTANNSASAVKQVWGGNPRFEVRPCPCYPGHFDPQTVWFS